MNLRRKVKIDAKEIARRIKLARATLGDGEYGAQWRDLTALADEHRLDLLNLLPVGGDIGDAGTIDAPREEEEPPAEEQPESPYQAEPMATYGEPVLLIDVARQAIVRVADGQALAAFGNDPLAEAVRLLGDVQQDELPVLGVAGNVRAGGLTTIGAGDSDSKNYVAHWGETRPMRFAVVGVTPDATIREFGLRDRMNDGTRMPGAEDVTFADLAIESRYGRCIGSPGGEGFGTLRCYNVRFRGDRDRMDSFGGTGYKWGIRAKGRGSWDIRYCHFDRVQEHTFYVDSPQGPTHFIGNTMDGSWRTMCQIVNRAVDNPGLPGNGLLLFENNRPYGIHGEGGGAFTVVGHHGPVVFRGNVQDDPNPTYGSIVVWADASSHHGWYPDENGYTTSKVVIESHRAHIPQGDRPVMALSSIGELDIHSFDIRGRNIGIALETDYSHRWKNGTTRFCVDHDPLSAYPGFNDTPRKVWSGHWQGTDQVHTLTDEEIDALRTEDCR